MKGRHTAEDLAFLREKGFVETADEIERLQAVEDSIIPVQDAELMTVRGNLGPSGARPNNRCKSGDRGSIAGTR